MTSSIPVSSALLKSLSQGRVYDADLARAYETGEAHTRRASSGPALPVSRLTSRFISRGTRKHPTSPDKEASRERKRSWAGSGMPRFMWRHYTEGERAVLCVVGDQVKRFGYCDLPIDRVAAVAGVSRTTVQNALRKARASELAHVTVEERPRVGRKNLTNIIRIISSAWLGWLKRCIGFKKVSPTVAKESRSSFKEPVARSQGAFENERAGERGSNIMRLKGCSGEQAGEAPLNDFLRVSVWPANGKSLRHLPDRPLMTCMETQAGGGLQLWAGEGDRRGEKRVRNFLITMIFCQKNKE